MRKQTNKQTHRKEIKRLFYLIFIWENFVKKIIYWNKDKVLQDLAFTGFRIMKQFYNDSVINFLNQNFLYYNVLLKLKVNCYLE
jgi:hypothetical protein